MYEKKIKGYSLPIPPMLNCYELKINYYIYRMFQVSFTGAMKQKPTEDEDEERESKYTTMENSQRMTVKEKERRKGTTKHN